MVTTCTYRTHVRIRTRTKDFINGGVGWQSTVENGELPLQTAGDIIPPAPGMNHGRHELNVNNGGEIARLLQTVHALHFHHLPHYLVGHLIAPFVDDWHVDVINKGRHFLSGWRAISTANSLVHIALYRSLRTQSAV